MASKTCEQAYRPLLEARIKRLGCIRKKGESKMNDQKAIRVERLELIDKWGRTMAVFGAEQGIPYIARYDGKGRILSWLTFLVDGTPDIKFFSANEAEKRRPEQVANGKESLT